ncbi:hypothetical protein ACP8HZ_07665 [Francisella noatunensis]
MVSYPVKVKKLIIALLKRRYSPELTLWSVQTLRALLIVLNRKIFITLKVTLLLVKTIKVLL